MSAFYLAIVIMFAGFVVIALLIFKEKGKDIPVNRKSPSAASGTPVTTADVLNRLGLESPLMNSNTTKPAAPGRLPWENFFKKKAVAVPLPPAPQPQAAPRGTAAMTIEPYVAAEAAQITKHESELSLKHDELQAQYKELEEKYNRLDALFHEKSDNLEKTEKNLSHEIKTHKEFNKVKDIFEKELKETKDRCRNLQIDVTSAQTEAATYLKRVNQLEEKIKKLEIGALAAEAAINDAQAETQVARKRTGELEEKLRNAESQMQEKNRKIEDLVNKLKEPVAASAVKPGEVLEQKMPSPQPVEPHPVPAGIAVGEEGEGDGESQPVAFSVSYVPEESAPPAVPVPGDGLSLAPDIIVSPPQPPVSPEKQHAAPGNPVPSQSQENNPSETEQPKESSDAN